MTWVVAGGLVFWLVVCAVYDLRTRSVPNVLTVPPFVLAGLWAVRQGGATLWLFVLAVAVMVFSFWKGGTGGADGKILAVLAVFMPAGFLLAVVLRLVVGVGLWMRHGKGARFPAVPVFAAGAILSVPVSIILQGGFSYVR
ncbi:type IV leader peptidase family [Anaerolinea thermolimosa]|uniref:prepilin peptidase n=1 Tax=Anaerolinea thermolimosa TaxID=229919 RepID=UPI00078598DF|nr:A24 family peptidase [Anaerolinea thermolimosa]GAP06147.1 type IV leader peptidase family [Anaerolinea thermolimosa]